MKKILILGAKGTLGQALADAYTEIRPTVWDREELDITDEQQVLEKISALKPDLIYNCASYNWVDKIEEEIALAESINGYAVGGLARTSAQCGAVLVHFSSNYVFDGGNPEGYNEDDKPKPINSYGKSKRLGEIELEQNAEKFYLVRTAWLYGKISSGKKSFVDLMLDLANQDKPIRAVGDEFGQPTFSKDLSQALVSLTEEEKPYGTYHITNAGSTSWHDWAKEIFRIKNIKANMSQIKSEDLKRPAKRPKFGILNSTKFIELRPWTEALREYLA